MLVNWSRILSSPVICTALHVARAPSHGSVEPTAIPFAVTATQSERDSHETPSMTPTCFRRLSCQVAMAPRLGSVDTRTRPPSPTATQSEDELHEIPLRSLAPLTCLVPHVAAK